MQASWVVGLVGLVGLVVAVVQRRVMLRRFELEQFLEVKELHALRSRNTELEQAREKDRAQLNARMVEIQALKNGNAALIVVGQAQLKASKEQIRVLRSQIADLERAPREMSVIPARIPIADSLTASPPRRYLLTPDLISEEDADTGAHLGPDEKTPPRRGSGVVLLVAGGKEDK